MNSSCIEIDIDFEAESLREKYAGVGVSICKITPEIARKWLEHNTRNRSLNKDHWRRFRDAIARNEWWMNGETIIFSSSGVLLNGQHRLTAIANGLSSVDVMVVRGIDEDAFKTIDGVRSRTSGDVLSVLGEVRFNQVASCVQGLVTFVDAGMSVPAAGSGGRKVTPSMCESVLSRNPAIRDSVRQMSRATLYRNQFSMALHYAFSRVRVSLAGEFADVLANGHSDTGRPFVIFRESLVRTPHRPDLRRYYAGKFVKAWNAEMTGERPKLLRFNENEEFPSIVGLDYDKFAEQVG